MSTLREYSVTLYKYEDLDGFYQDMETPGGNLYIPDRAVDITARKPSSRSTLYMLTEDEAAQLRQDPRVEWVELSAKERGLVPILDTWEKSIGRFGYGLVQTDEKQWGLLRTGKGESIWSQFSSSTTGTLRAALSGDDWIYNSKLGLDVDVIISDGLIQANHIEFATSDSVSTSRVVKYEWNQHWKAVFGYDGSWVGQYPYELKNPYDDRHGTHVASTVAGLSQGWAVNANIYNLGFPGIDFAITIIYHFDFIKQFHLNKPINPKYGDKNPTVVNASWGMNKYMNTGIPETTAITVDTVVDHDDIDRIVYRGVTYTRPFTFRQLINFRLVTNHNIEDRLGTRHIRSGDRSYDMDSDLADLAGLDGVIIVSASGNLGMYIDVPGGADYNNRVLSSTQNINDPTAGVFYNRGSSPSAARSSNVGQDPTRVICVNNLQINDTLSPGSNRGPRTDITAPGSGIKGAVTASFTGLFPDTTGRAAYQQLSGTSMASPQVAGVLAIFAGWARLNGVKVNQERAHKVLETFCSVKDQIREQLTPQFTPLLDTPNRILYLPGVRVYDVKESAKTIDFTLTSGTPDAAGEVTVTVSNITGGTIPGTKTTKINFNVFVFQTSPLSPLFRYVLADNTAGKTFTFKVPTGFMYYVTISPISVVNTPTETTKSVNLVGQGQLTPTTTMAVANPDIPYESFKYISIANTATTSSTIISQSFDVSDAHVQFFDISTSRTPRSIDINLRANAAVSLSNFVQANQRLDLTLYIKTKYTTRLNLTVDGLSLNRFDFVGSQTFFASSNKTIGIPISFTKQNGVLRGAIDKLVTYNPVPATSTTLPAVATAGGEPGLNSIGLESADTSVARPPVARQFNPTLQPASGVAGKALTVSLVGGPTNSLSGTVVIAKMRRKASVDSFFGIGYQADTWVSMRNIPGEETALLNGVFRQTNTHRLPGNVTYELTYAVNDKYTIAGGNTKTFVIPIVANPATIMKYELTSDWHVKYPGQAISLLFTTNDPTGTYQLQVTSRTGVHWRQLIVDDGTFDRSGNRLIPANQAANRFWKVKVALQLSVPFSTRDWDLQFSVVRNRVTVVRHSVKIQNPTARLPGPQDFNYLLTVDTYSKTYGEVLGVFFYTKDKTPDRQFRLRHSQFDLVNNNEIATPIINTVQQAPFRVYNTAGTGSSADNLDDPAGVKVLALPIATVSVRSKIVLFVDRLLSNGTWEVCASTSPILINPTSLGRSPNEIIQVDTDTKISGNAFNFFVSVAGVEDSTGVDLILNRPNETVKVFNSDTLVLKQLNRANSFSLFKRAVVAPAVRAVTTNTGSKVYIQLANAAGDTEEGGSVTLSYLAPNNNTIVPPVPPISPAHTYKLIPTRKVYNIGETIGYQIETTEPDGTILNFAVNTAFSSSGVSFANIFTDNKTTGNVTVQLGSALFTKQFSTSAVEGTVIAFDLIKGTQTVLAPNVSLPNNNIPIVVSKARYWYDTIGAPIRTNSEPVLIVSDEIGIGGGYQAISGRSNAQASSFAISSSYGNFYTAMQSVFPYAPVTNKSRVSLTASEAMSGHVPVGSNLTNPFAPQSNLVNYYDVNRPKILVLRLGINDAFLNSRIDTVFGGNTTAASNESVNQIRSLTLNAVQLGIQVVLIGPNPTAPAKPHASFGFVDLGFSSAYYAKANTMLDSLNTGLINLAESFPTGIKFVNVRQLVSTNGGIPNQSLPDGIHPTPEFGGFINSLIARNLASQYPVVEGSSLAYTNWTSGIPPATSVAYQITGVTSLDFSDNPPLRGNFNLAGPANTTRPIYTTMFTSGGWNKEFLKKVGNDVLFDCLVKGNEIIVSEDVATPGTAPTGSDLVRIVAALKAGGWRVGVMLNAQSIIQPIPVISQGSMDNIVANSGIDFVVLKAYANATFNPGNLFPWVTNAINKYRQAPYSKGIKLLVQGWYHTNLRDTVGYYIQSLVDSTNVEEFVYVPKFAADDATRLNATVSDYMGHGNNGPDFPLYAADKFLTNQLVGPSINATYRTLAGDTDSGDETMNFRLTDPILNKSSQLVLANATGVINTSANVVITERLPVVTVFSITSPANEGTSVQVNFTIQDITERWFRFKITPIGTTSSADFTGTTQYKYLTANGIKKLNGLFVLANNDGSDPVETYYVDFELENPDGLTYGAPFRRFGPYSIVDPTFQPTTTMVTTTTTAASLIDFTLSSNCWTELGSVGNISVSNITGSTTNSYLVSWPYYQGGTPFPARRATGQDTIDYYDLINGTYFVRVSDTASNQFKDKSIVINCPPRPTTTTTTMATTTTTTLARIDFTLSTACNPRSIQVSNLSGGNGTFRVSYPFIPDPAVYIIDDSNVYVTGNTVTFTANATGNVLIDDYYIVRVMTPGSYNSAVFKSMAIQCGGGTTTTSTTTTTLAPTTTTTIPPIDFTVTYECNPAYAGLANVIISNPTGGVGPYRTYAPVPTPFNAFTFFEQKTVAPGIPAIYPNRESILWSVRVYDNRNTFTEKRLEINCLAPTTTTLAPTTTTLAPTTTTLAPTTTTLAPTTTTTTLALTTTTTTAAPIDFTVAVVCNAIGFGNITISNPTGGSGSYITYRPYPVDQFNYIDNQIVAPFGAVTYLDFAYGTYGVRVYDQSSNSYTEKFVDVLCIAATTTTTTILAPTTTTTTLAPTTTTTTVALIDFTVTVECNANGLGNITISNPTGGVDPYRTYNPVPHLVNFEFNGQTAVSSNSPVTFSNYENGVWTLRVYDNLGAFREKFVTVNCVGTTTTTTLAPTTTTTTLAPTTTTTTVALIDFTVTVECNANGLGNITISNPTGGVDPYRTYAPVPDLVNFEFNGQTALNPGSPVTFSDIANGYWAVRVYDNLGAFREKFVTVNCVGTTTTTTLAPTTTTTTVAPTTTTTTTGPLFYTLTSDIDTVLQGGQLELTLATNDNRPGTWDVRAEHPTYVDVGTANTVLNSGQRVFNVTILDNPIIPGQQLVSNIYIDREIGGVYSMAVASVQFTIIKI